MHERFAMLMGVATVIAWSQNPSLGQVGHGGHGTPSPQRFSVEIRLGSGSAAKILRSSVELPSPNASADLRQRIVLPAPLAAIQLRQFLPKAERHQKVTPDESPGARPMTLVSITGPTQSFSRWLVAGDPERNRLISLIATWRFMAVEDRTQRDHLLVDFETEHSRPPMIRVVPIDGGRETTVLANPGTVHELPHLGGQLIVREFFSHYALSNKTNKPLNASPKRVNPAVLLELRFGDTREQRWVFSQFPDYTGEKPSVIPWKCVLDCPAEGKRPRPDVAIVVTHDADWEAWVRHGGATETFDAAGATSIELPSTPYRFRLSRTIRSGRLVETYRQADGRGTEPALLVETLDAKGRPISIWLTPGKPRIMLLETGPATLTLTMEGGPGKGHP